jgi:hypothetical protein
MTQLQKYGIAAGAFIVFLVISVVYVIHWDAHNVSSAVTARDGVWRDSLFTARHIIDTVYKPQPRQSVSFTSKPKPEPAKPQVDFAAISRDSLIIIADSLRRENNYMRPPVDTTIRFATGDSVRFQYNPPTRMGSAGLIPFPRREINDRVLVGEPCPSVPWYDSKPAWFGYGAAAIIIVVKVLNVKL